MPVLHAQTLDPTVQVSRSYEGKLMEVHKPALKMAVPDSVLRFDLDFDYSVFDSPYKGSYEFNPYATSMRPAVSFRRPSTFYLRAGAGYTFHPVFDMVWSPVSDKAFSVDVFASNRSYIGEYRDVTPANFNPVAGYGTWKGKDMVSKAGANFHWNWKKSRLGLGAEYNGLHRRNIQGTDNCMNAVALSSRFTSRTNWPSDTKYDLGLSYRITKDVMNGSPSGKSILDEHNVEMDFTFGPATRGEHSFYFDVAMMMASYTGFINTSISEAYVIPHYVIKHDRLKVDAGIRLAKLMRSDGYVYMYKTREQFIYPDVRIDVEAVRNALMLYLRIGGGNKINTYSSLLESNRFLTMASGYGNFPLLDTTVEKLSIIFGAESRIFSVLDLNFKVGFVNYKNAVSDAIWMILPQTGLLEDGQFVSGVAYSPFKKWLLGLDWAYRSETFRVEGEIEYNYAWGEDFTRDAALGLLRPAELKGDISVGYDWKKRVYVGIDCMFSSSRSAFVPSLPDRTEVLEMKVPGYADLGLEAEYSAGSRLAFWTRLGNILDQPVMYLPLYAEKGFNFTVGISLNF